MAKLLSLSNAMYNIERILQLHGNIYEKATTFLRIRGYIVFLCASMSITAAMAR